MLVGSSAVTLAEGTERCRSGLGRGRAVMPLPPVGATPPLLAPRQCSCCSSEPSESQGREGAQREEDGRPQRDQRERSAGRRPGCGAWEAGHAVPGPWTRALAGPLALPCLPRALRERHRVGGLWAEPGVGWAGPDPGPPREPRDRAGACWAGHPGQPAGPSQCAVASAPRS